MGVRYNGRVTLEGAWGGGACKAQMERGPIRDILQMDEERARARADLMSNGFTRLYRTNTNFGLC